MAMISTAAQAISPTASLIKTPSDLHGSLVGSYEESILTGRMSSLPSKPILFLAEIGVVGHGKCPPGLRCPPHVSAPFNAFYYEVGEEESVTPYVGCVDVAAAASASANALQEAASRDAMGIDVAGVSNRHNGDNPRRPKRDGYRIPPKGQLQIVIKNPSRTAIKLFLLPYDFRDMPPNSKTILRQKSYSFSGTPGTSTSSVPSTPISHQKSGTASVSTTTTAAGVRHHSKDPFESTNTHLAPHSTEAKPPRPHSASVTPTHHAKPPIHPSTTPSTTTTPSPAKQHLRYAIHIPIFRTAKSVYIGPTLRVVFSHRAVDGDEKVVVVSEGFGTGEGRYVAFGAGFR
ncbi:uncharacterized protein EV422DRAFT_502898 [Fimicolochytrium jonesii]|uniref:uncharacterized protein n=1 Tax=Fimicolochytrium jonesii TaxID=1396493 RepID=UPI0022FDFEAA|nr:uncharacterized protein EV422DRAFT_502898 [Fimicolochytrium jonesii]KAI8827206.1 hypothetical protein EV422DRAFT_502898 [Fimicolochytrium jonesii]